ncbi:MAG: ABC transporter ATP-binding protein [Eubacteriales bacterium]
MSDSNNRKGPPPGGFGPPGGRGPVEKPKDFVGSLKKILAYSKAYFPMMLCSVLFAIVASSCSLAGPDKLREMTDLIMVGLRGEIDLDGVSAIAYTLIALYVTALVFGYAQGFIPATVSQKICKKMRAELVDKLDRLPLSYFDGRSYGNILSIVTNDVDTIGTSLNQSLASLISGIVTFLGALFLMFLTNSTMAISALLSTMIGFVLMKFIISNSQKFFSAQQEELGKLNGHIEESYTGHTIIKAYTSEPQVEETFFHNNEALYRVVWKAQFVSGLMMPIMGFVGNFSYVVVCVVGAILVIEGSTTFGVIVAFMIYIRMFTQPLSSLAQAATTLQGAAAASERVFELLAQEELSDESGKVPYQKEVTGEVHFKEIKFGYQPDKLILKGFSAHIKAGQKVAIVGPTGAGKTTLVNLLMRFYELNSGDILLDGTSITQMTREDLHDLFAMVLQDTWMFEGSIMQNIAYSKTDITEEEIITACKAVGIHHTISTLPQGYHTILSESTLSVGEKQLITIARAMVKKAELLILDEATSSVDTRTELLIARALDTLSQGKTSFIIAHRLSTIKNADFILVMKDGDIIESGNHDELLSQSGFYADLYNSQFDPD